MNSTWRTRWPGYLVLLLLVLGLVAWVSFSGRQRDFKEKYAELELEQGLEDLGRQDTYTLYQSRHAQAARPQADIQVDVLAFVDAQGVEITQGEDGQPMLATQEGSDLTWQVDVPTAGLYRLHLQYYALPARGVDIERALYINGELPFLGADTLLLPRMWTDAGPVRTDNQGNQIRPAQAEVFGWQSAYFKDPLGYELLPYSFYFREGINTIRLQGINEPLGIRALALHALTDLPSYADYRAAHAHLPAGPTEQVELSIQGEEAVLRSSPSLYARYDRSSPATQPQNLRQVVLNYTGGDPWRIPGQWIEWALDVPEDGWYQLTLKGRQRYQRGAKSSRSLYIDGQIPFAELAEIPFEFDNAWQMKTLGDDKGPYQLYLSRGRHSLRLEATLGGMGHILRQLDDSVYRLNQIYRRILVLTGVNPDPYRDYNIHQVYPEVITAMATESARLYKIVDEATAYTGQKSDKIAAAQTLATQLEDFAKDPYRITVAFVNFKDNITALGTAMQAMGEIKLDIDLISLHGSEVLPSTGPENVLTGLWHEGRSTAISYFVDYDALGDVYDEEEALQVWLLTGRDQSTVLKTMVDDSFTPESGIKVNIKLVDPTALLGAVVAGNGPDVVVTTDSWNPVNYALRNAVEDLTQFADFDTVIADFRESAYAALTWEGGVYGLPETQVISMLFYRADILAELGLDVPRTWEELIGILPTIQGNNMSLGIPYPSIAAPNQNTLYSLIYQGGGTIYNEAATRTLLNEENAVQAFDFYTALYTDFGLPKEFDFISRFRSGEMPLGIADFTTFNVLAVSAPEIRGLWDFALIPGTMRTAPDGSSYLDRSAHSQGASCMMIATDDQAVKDQAWAFMKWWVGKEAQVRFGREIEAVLGSSARYPTANTQALRELSWSARHLAVLEEGMASAVGFREIAGGYYTTRNITNAVRRVINRNANPRETILDYARLIDKEITSKRAEFGLDTATGGQP